MKKNFTFFSLQRLPSDLECTTQCVALNETNKNEALENFSMKKFLWDSSNSLEIERFPTNGSLLKAAILKGYFGEYSEGLF